MKTEQRLNRSGFPIRNECSICGEDFTSLAAFDSHVLSKPSDPDFDCLQVPEMEAAGWTQDERGRWTSPELAAKAAQMREAFSQAEPASETPSEELVG